MAKLQKTETTYYIYEYEMSNEDLELYSRDEDTFWDQFEEDDWGDCCIVDVDSTPPEIEFYED